MSQVWLNAVFREFPQAALDADPAVCFLLDEKLRLAYCNPAWDLFASQNGAPHLLRSKVVGTPVLECSSGRILEYYRSLYEDVLAGREPRSHDFHCSSSERERLMQMHVYRLRQTAALLVVCSLRVEGPHHWVPAEPVQTTYRNEFGLIVMCSNCRRTRRAGVQPPVWDWIPQFVAEQPGLVSHGICNTCLEYYYPTESFASR